MNIQELLTYVEELSFKTSMIGYDKDEVDIQLDKICDEIEAIVKEKDDEILALRGGAPAAPVVVDLKGQDDEKDEEESTPEPFASMDDDEAAAMIDELKIKIKNLEADLADANDKAETAKLKIASLEEELEIVKADADTYKDELERVLAEQAEEAEEAKVEEIVPVVAPEPASPRNTDEAYQLYMKNADLLCKQLAAVDLQKEAVIAEATKEADSIIENATNESSRIIDQATAQAEEITKEAESKIQSAQEEVEKILADGQLKAKKEQEDYMELLARKDSLVKYMGDINEDIAALLGKMKETLPIEE
jgi:cell division septum initiation protein DivIVA